MEMVQLAATFTDPPARENVDAPGAAVLTPAEPQVPFSPLGLSTVRPAGRGSVKPTPESVPLALGLAMVMESAVAVESPAPISLGVKALVTVGGIEAAMAEPA